MSVDWSLDGDWLVRAAGHGEWRTVADRTLDESGWQKTATPGRWWHDPGLGGESAVLYRRRFDLSPDLESQLGSGANPDERWWFVVNGLCELGHLWLDGTYLGDLSGRHTEHAFEITDLLTRDGEHLAAVEASHGTVRVPQSADGNVHILRTGPARIERVRALVIEASFDRAVLRVAATVDSSGTHHGEVTTTVLPIDDPDAGWSKDPTRQVAMLGDGLAHSEPVLARGRNELEWLVALERPSLWWPAGMGDQEQYCIDIDIAIDGRSSHAVRLPTGIRTVSIRRGSVAVNGEPHPAGLDALEVVEHELSHPSAYEAANGDGRLLCQHVTLDPSVFTGAERGLRALAAKAAAAAADHAGHHPSIAAWQPVQPSGGRRRAPWIRPWADRTIRHAMRSADPTRPLRFGSGPSRLAVSPAGRTWRARRSQPTPARRQ
ncbi:hypothetical protein [Candidatus Poriferisodalis sp.]|uniref:hypothetical protein n=1 Tax=Candidatus Poriferisodalis sp. TaxID=3101277 RepID=UPI003B5281D8